MSVGRSKDIEKDRLSSFMGIVLFGFLSLLALFWLIWPNEVKPLSSSTESVVVDADIPSTLKSLEVDQGINESVPPEKRDAISQRGLGASLAQAPLPKPHPPPRSP